MLIVGCEYAGKTTLAVAISNWMIEVMGFSYVRWHNHFVVPRVDGHLVVRAPEAAGRIVVPGKQAAEEFGEEEQEQILALKPVVLEQFQRHMIWRHLHPSVLHDDDILMIDFYYADAVYAPLYYGYGEPGTFADRQARARAWDAVLMGAAPDTVLVLVKASADTIVQRMRQEPRARCPLKGPDVGVVLARFEEEYANSLIGRRFALDTTGVTVTEVFEEFLGRIEPYLTEADRLRILTHQALRRVT
jgi:hypothetical protein